MEDINAFIKELSDSYNISEKSILNWYKMLVEQKRGKSYTDMECLNRMCEVKLQVQDLAIQDQKDGKKVDFSDYRFTNNYLVNKAIYDVYGEDSNYWLDDDFRRYIGFDPYMDEYEELNMYAKSDKNASELLLVLQYNGELSEDYM